MTVADILEMIRNSFFAVTENLSSDDSRSITAQFASAIAENINMADSSTQISTFNQSIIENMILLDFAIARGWIKINDTQNPNWVQIDNTQA
jgi:hypothetical protein